MSQNVIGLSGAVKSAEKIDASWSNATTLLLYQSSLSSSIILRNKNYGHLMAHHLHELLKLSHSVVHLHVVILYSQLSLLQPHCSISFFASPTRRLLRLFGVHLDLLSMCASHSSAPASFTGVFLRDDRRRGVLLCAASSFRIFHGIFHFSSSAFAYPLCFACQDRALVKAALRLFEGVNLFSRPIGRTSSSASWNCVLLVLECNV